MEFRLFQEDNLPEVLDLIDRSISTNRSVDTWHSNNMTGVLAYDEGKLIGAIPLEPRIFSLGNNEFIKILWVSAAHVDPEYRSQGIGGGMDLKIKDYYYPDYKGVFVYREDEKSAAYRWYMKNGYQKLLSILSLRKEVGQSKIPVKCQILQTEAEFQEFGEQIYNCFDANTKMYGGFPKRDRLFWAAKSKTHYYKESYDYSMVLVFSGTDLQGYAFLGKTDIKDGVKRFDILEMIYSDTETGNSLLASITGYARSEGLSELRIQMSQQDPGLDWIKSQEFTVRWETNMLGKLMDPIQYLEDRLPKKIDLESMFHLRIQIPALGARTIGKGTNALSIKCRDDVLTKLALRRADIRDIAEEDSTVFMDGEVDALNLLQNVFTEDRWLYFHIDYI